MSKGKIFEKKTCFTSTKMSKEKIFENMFHIYKNVKREDLWKHCFHYKKFKRKAEFDEKKCFKFTKLSKGKIFESMDFIIKMSKWKIFVYNSFTQENMFHI